MARRYYGMNKGDQYVTAESSSTTSKDFEVSVDLAVGFERVEIHNKLNELKQFILKGNWPAAATTAVMKRWGLNRGEQDHAVGSDIPDYATLTNQTIVYTAVTAGTAGNSITIALVDPAGNNQALAVSVISSAISVSLATGVAGAITTTRAQLVAAINADASASALVSASGSGATAITALSATPLATGAAASVTNDDIYLDLKMSASLSTVELTTMFEAVKNRIQAGIWPPA